MTGGVSAAQAQLTTAGPISRQRAALAVAALATALFACTTVESLPVGLLPQIAHGLGVSLPSVGLLVTGYSLVVAVTAVPLTALTRRVPRRLLLAVLLGSYSAGTVLCAVAPGYRSLLVARVLIALTHAVIWSVVAATAAGMFPAQVRAKVVAALFSGSSLAQVAGVPAGTWLGQQAGWRVPFAAMGALCLAAGAVVVALLPTAPVEANPAARAPEPSRVRFALLVTAVALVVAGFFTFYTYVSVFLTRVTGTAPETVGAVLAVGGVAGLIGTSASGTLADRDARATMTLSVGLVATALVLLAVAGSHAPAAVTGVAVLGFAVSAMITALTSRVLRIAPGHVDVASATGSAAFNVGIALGSLLGGRLLDARGPHSTALVGGCLAAVGLAVLLAEEPLNGRVTRE
ncbi:MFS transporter [Actinacidiphila acidipaludis]|uniref:MFS transporter n=1 Tax=Actinacidiphila acidipaludis TaxID=2873382 RepID=A0ABS7Q253_9ACTN|nr:MFS transporter [Streptomyces acidipaludis]MBY8877224.1 MFS transporter [Streptomyces acidipaludis]